jgi:hypothetical protein
MSAIQRQEIPNNTPDQVFAYVNAALALVDQIEPPDDLRAPVFEKACDLFAGKQVLMVQPQSVDLGALGLGRGKLS